MGYGEAPHIVAEQQDQSQIDQLCWSGIVYWLLMEDAGRVPRRLAHGDSAEVPMVGELLCTFPIGRLSVAFSPERIPDPDPRGSYPCGWSPRGLMRPPHHPLRGTPSQTKQPGEEEVTMRVAVLLLF